MVSSSIRVHGLRHAFIGVIATLLAMLIVDPNLSNASGDNKEDGEKSTTVKLVIDFGDGFQKVYPSIPWVADMTVLDALNKAKDHSRGTKFRYTGSGATAFLTEIDSLKNQAGGADKKNWLYRVNGKRADKSFGVYSLNADDEIVWSFDVFKK
jgi:uncharacterized protein DUF4430